MSRPKACAKIKWSINAAAIEFGVSRETLTRGLKRIEKFDPKKSDYTSLTIHLALSGDLKYERTRRERAEADKAEVESAIAKKEVIPTHMVSEFIIKSFSPIREQLMALPGAESAKCNPGDPSHARTILESAVDRILKHCREHVPEVGKYKKEEES